MGYIGRVLFLEDSAIAIYAIFNIILLIIIASAVGSSENKSGEAKEQRKTNYYNDSPTKQQGVYEIVGVSGTHTGQTFRLTPGEDLFIGRDPMECQIVINDYKNVISRKHCLIHCSGSGSGVYITDYSHNGTFMDGKKLTYGISYKMFDGVRFSLAGNNDCFILRRA